ncbi:hypothetical protein N9955_00465 [bacterium]|nr:hypothetical protein [bacterium]
MKTKEQILKEIDDKIDAWHNDGEDHYKLHEHLGWTDHQYSLFVEKGIIPNESWELNEIEKPKPWIVCAANKHKKTHLIICGARHWDSLMRGQVEAMGGYNYNEWTQGFVDQFGEYYNREEAHKIAKSNNQIIKYHGGDKVTLFSENLY